MTGYQAGAGGLGVAVLPPLVGLKPYFFDATPNDFGDNGYDADCNYPYFIF